MECATTLKLLNLGCGERYHKDWTNVDFVSYSHDVMAHNLLNGIPFPDNHFDVVYHSHLLEHFSRENAPGFIRECWRVLRSGGTIRVAVPDLERIARAYLEQLELALRGGKEAGLNYEWIMLEMYDQTVRNHSGGEMGKLYRSGYAPNADFIHERVGVRLNKENKIEGNMIETNALAVRVRDLMRLVGKHPTPQTGLFIIRNLLSEFRYLFLRIILWREYRYYELGRFRLSGEIHQWMYDRFSLSKLLVDCNFKEMRVCSARQSRIPNWESFHLDANLDGTVYKPDSLYMEATK